MKRFAWITDPHFDCLTDLEVVNFLLSIKEENIDGVFLTGDISIADHLIKHLQWMSKIINKPTYYVIGNHDLWGSYLQAVNQNLTQLSDPNLIYLNYSGDIALNHNTGLIGSNGFYDIAWRQPLTNFVFLWDWFSIKDFRYLPSDTARLNLIQEWAENYTQDIINKLTKAFKKYSTIYLLTHIPPWPEKNYSLGELANKFWSPYNSCKILAEALTNLMNQHLDKNLIILAGHIHKQRIEQITPNIELQVGEAWHGKVKLQDIIVLPN